MKLSPFIWRVLILTISVLAISMLVSMDLDTGKIKRGNTDIPVVTPASMSTDVSIEPFKEYIDDSAQYVLESYLEAIGGLEQWEQVVTIHTTGLMSLRAGNSTPLTYGKDMYQGPNGYLIEEIMANNSRLSQVMQNGKVMTVVHNDRYPQTGLDALVFKEYLLPIGGFNELKTSAAEYLGKHRVNGKLVHKLFLGQQLGYDVFEYYDVYSNLKLMVAFGDACTIEFGHYKAVNGLKIPSSIQARFKDFGKRVSYEIEQVELNVGIPALPIDIKMLSAVSK